MPHLVQGHMRFTEDDFLQTDYLETTTKRYQDKSFLKLAELLKSESEQLLLLKEREINELFNTEQNIKRALAQALSLITAMAEREGYTLKELIYCNR
jgi:hypothetical protein